MKTFKLIGIFLAIITLNCKKYSEGNLSEIKKTQFKLEFPNRKYFAVQQGQKLKLVYQIENTGNEILFVTNVQTSCGCLTSTFPTSPISKGDKGIIKLEFDSSKSLGFVEHFFTIVSNSDTIYKEFKFETNVVPNSLYTKDYEEIYNEKIKNEALKENVDGDNTDKGFEVIPSTATK
jgi:Protein of unknown function (DUF1573)